jgi:electron transport complex protein RnfG
MSANNRKALGSAIVLIVIVAGIAAALSLVDSLSRERIHRNELSWILQRLDALVPPSAHDNDLLDDVTQVVAPDLLGTDDPVDIYRARMRGQPVAAIVHTVAPYGYRGPIDLLVAIAADGSLLGVQVIGHNETPGLGDQFEHDGGRWLNALKGRSLKNPSQSRWSLRRDGGEFDAFTGATITPRAIVKAVRQALEYFRANQRQIFEAKSPAP